MQQFALIGFDNAIEVCIDVYLRLHPRVRNGVNIERDEVQKALVSYQTKVDFLDKHVAAR